MIKRLSINALIVSLLTLISFAWSFWIFHQDFSWTPVLAVIALRIALSSIIFSDYSASWSRASSRSFLIKTFINGIAFVIYMPIFHYEVRVALFISELFFYLFTINFAMYGYQYFQVAKTRKKDRNLVVYGAGKAGLQVVKELGVRYQLQAYVDDNKKLWGRSVDGVKILSKAQFSQLTQTKIIDLLVIAMPSSQGVIIQKTYQFCLKSAKKVRVLPSLDKILLSQPYSQQLKSIDIKDLLARNPADLDTKIIKDFINQKTVLITGAGGTIGSELAKQCLEFGAKQLILLDHSEFNLYKIEQDLASDKVVPILVSVTNLIALEQVFNQYVIDVVMHAAAYKHVPMVEANINQAIVNNVLGTKTLIDTAIKAGVEKLVLISTDKAVRPTNVMGTTKRICELYAQNVDSKQTQIVSVRFGNVLGSSGSVIPLFEQQIAQGGPVTVTHPDITRYFMLVNEACALVLQASVLGRGGEVFILDMGQPIKIASLAQQMIELSGADDIKITFSGLRPGEKLYEELLINDSNKDTSYPSITVAKMDVYPIKDLNQDIQNLLNNDDKLLELKKIVPEFIHKP